MLDFGHISCVTFLGSVIVQIPEWSRIGSGPGLQFKDVSKGLFPAVNVINLCVKSDCVNKLVYLKPSPTSDTCEESCCSYLHGCLLAGRVDDCSVALL